MTARARFNSLGRLMICVASVCTLWACASTGELGVAARPFAGRTVVVTGASSGFGRGVALAMGARGANVVLAARRREPLETAAAAIRATGGAALVVPTDVSRSAEVVHLAQAAVDRFGRIDVWVNDAGVIAIGRFNDTPLAEHERVIDVNLKGVLYGSYEALGRFRRQHSGVLINLGSIESRVPLPYQASYVASKHAILGMDEALRQELSLEGQRNVQVVTIMPWGADTPIWDHAANYTGRETRAPSLDDPDKIVRAVMWAALHPRARVAVGWKAKSAVAGENLAPGATEHMAGVIYDKVQMHGVQPSAPATSGSVHTPMSSGVTVDGGLRARWRTEDHPASKGVAPAPPRQPFPNDSRDRSP